MQFEDKETTDKCLANKDKLVFKSHKLEVTAFTTKSQRPELNSNNLYMKNIPKMSTEDCTQKLY